MFEVLPLNLSLSEKRGCISIKGVDFSVLLSQDEVTLGLLKCQSNFMFFLFIYSVHTINNTLNV